MGVVTLLLANLFTNLGRYHSWTVGLFFVANVAWLVLGIAWRKWSMIFVQAVLCLYGVLGISLIMGK